MRITDHLVSSTLSAYFRVIFLLVIALIHVGSNTRLPCAGADRSWFQVQALPPELREIGKAWIEPFLHYESRET